MDESCRRTGIGKKLYESLLEQAKKEQVDAIELNVFSFNESAKKFYEALGMSVKSMVLEQNISHDEKSHTIDKII